MSQRLNFQYYKAWFFSILTIVLSLFSQSCTGKLSELTLFPIESISQNTLVGTSWSICLSVGSKSGFLVVRFTTETDSSFDIYHYTNSNCAGIPKYYGGNIPDNYIYSIDSVNKACIPEGPTLRMNLLSSGDTQAVRFPSHNVMQLAEGSPQPGCDNPNFLNDFTNPTVFNLSTQALPANPPLPSTFANDVWRSCNLDVNGSGYSIGKVYVFDGNGTTATFTEYYYPDTSCDSRPTGILSVANVSYQLTLTGSTPEACLKVTDGGDTFMPITFPDSPSYSSLVLGDASAGPGCGTTFSTANYLFYVFPGVDIPPGLPNCAVTPMNTCPPN